MMEFEIKSSVPHKTSTNCNYTNLRVPVLSEETSYDAFFQNFMLKNIPCIFKNITCSWEANNKWLDKEKNPNLDYLIEKYGTCEVSIYNCNEKYYNSQVTESCKLKTYLETDWPHSNNKYLKDWHLKNNFKDDDFYKVPIYFASDWLNEFLTNQSEDDYRFVYMGPKGTWTPFHSDVFNSFSWSVNVCGQKKWVLFPPGQENALKDNLNNLPYDITNIYKNTAHLELIQNAGEAIFVPSGWHHQVWNLEDTISVNHNWVNGCNISQMWNSIQNNLDAVKKEIEDCKDMEGFTKQCQIVLKASFGMDFFKFYEFLEYIAKERLLFLRKLRTGVLYNGHVLGRQHALFDLTRVSEVLGEFMSHADFPDLFSSTRKGLELFLGEIVQFIKNEIKEL